MKNIIVCLKYGDRYDSEYVNKLDSMIKRNISVDYEFVCYTDDSHGIHSSISIEKLPKNNLFEKWWYKPTFFNSEISTPGTLLFMDLDVIVFDNIDKLFDYQKNKFCIIRDFNRHVLKNYDKFNSSVFRLNTGDHSYVHDEFVKDPQRITKRYRGDQDWIYAKVKKDFVYWPDSWIRSYKWEMRSNPRLVLDHNSEKNFAEPGDPVIQDGSSIAVFHGDPKPHNCVDPWCRENWR